MNINKTSIKAQKIFKIQIQKYKKDKINNQVYLNLK